MRIAVIGSLNTDITIKVPHFSRPNETVVGVGDYAISQGGKGANQAAAVAAPGDAEVFMIGKVGADDFGARAIESLESAGVDCSYVTKTPDHATGLATILVNDAGDNSITVAPGANAQVNSDDLAHAASIINGADIVVLQLEIPLKAVEEAIHLAHKGGAMVILDPAPAPAGELRCLGEVDFLTPNELEAETLTGISTQSPDGPEKAAQSLLEKGVKNAVLTLGGRGGYIANKDMTRTLAPLKVNAVDSTGAGDTFTGFFAVSLAKGMNFIEAAEFASAAAALSVTRPEARSNLPNWTEVEEFLSTQK